MSKYPAALDDDVSLPRIDDNITEIGQEAINSLRDAVFSMQKELGLNPAGSVGTLADRLNVSINLDGTIKASALTAAILPIHDNQVATNAGIQEHKLNLDFSTADLNTQIQSNSNLLTILDSFTSTINSNLLGHISGVQFLADGSTPGRHVGSHIDINASPSDPRDPSFAWDGLKDKDGNPRTAETVAEGLDQINTALTTHENLTANAHPATAITVDTDQFTEIPDTVTNVQEALDAIDDSDRIQIGIHRAIQHSNGIPGKALSEAVANPDGYSQTIVPPTQAMAFLVKPPATSPQDNTTTGDDVIKLLPDNTDFIFDSLFSQVKVGDIARINYGNGVEATFFVESKRHDPGVEWFIRINGVNLFNADGYEDGYASVQINRAPFDLNIGGVLAVAAANNDIDSDIMSSAIVGNPKGATAIGLDFDPNKIDSNHYNLYLQLYPSGSPADHVITLPAIDISGDSGASPGLYTLEKAVQATNNAFRAAGFNYRFIAFSHRGEFGIMLAEPYGGASFSIVSGERSGGSLVEGSFTNNVIGDATDGLDALGLGASRANIASPAFTSTFSSAAEALTPTNVIVPFRNRNYVVNGVRRDNFTNKPFVVGDGYWFAEITDKNIIGTTTTEIEYTINLDLTTAELKPGATIVVQPLVDFGAAEYTDKDYGRFIIKEVSFVRDCPTDPIEKTIIRVINAVHADGDPVGVISGVGLSVKIYYSEDSVSFNALNLIEPISSGLTYNRFHEIYATAQGTIFSHERARFPKVTGTVNLIDTHDRWIIHDVSPKLKGFPDSASSNLKRFVRFIITRYDSASGEFDGYIGEPAGVSGIANHGLITTARKNIPAKFYDNTNIDYIELEFRDLDGYAGADPVPATPRHIDIEVFTDLAVNEEVMRIAGCQLDNKAVNHVKDLREFGSISERDFTNSAINFITAGDRHLHENGVIRGIEFDGIDGSDSRLLHFKGGIAFINGKVVTVNNGSIVIPEIHPFGTSLPQVVRWAVCVNENGLFESIIITNDKTQFFANDDYYLPSVTFDELIDTRKDLTLVSLVDATISSINLSISDARRFVAEQGRNHSLVWSSPDSHISGHFTSFEQVNSWIRGLNSDNNKIILKGDFIIDEEIDLSEMTNDLSEILDGGLSNLMKNSIHSNTIIEGDGCRVFVNSSRGFVVGSHITFKNITFIYSGSGQFDSNNGCIYISPDTDGYINVQDCLFISFANNHPAFISLRVTTSDNIINNINIKDNTFIAMGSELVPVRGIGFVSTSTNNTLRNINISGNASNACAISITRTGLNHFLLQKCTIKDNDINTATITVFNRGNHAATDRNATLYGLVIDSNRCAAIISGTDIPDEVTTAVISTPTIISNNTAITILAYIDSSTLNITNNNLKSTISKETLGLSNYAGMMVWAFNDSSVNISNNNVNNTIQFSYEIGIGVFIDDSNGIISNNIVSGFTNHGIVLEGASSGYGTISNNHINRGNQTVQSYIQANIPAGATIVDNVFDSTTTDGSTGEITIDLTGDNYIVERNKNHINEFTLGLSGSGPEPHAKGPKGIGVYGMGQDGYVVFGGSVLSSFDSFIAYGGGTGIANITYLDQTNGPESAPLLVSFMWSFSLEEILPSNVKPISVSILLSGSEFTGASAAMLRISSQFESDVEAHTSLVTGGTVSITLTADFLNVGQTLNGNNIFGDVFVGIHETSSKILNIVSLSIKYVW